ncbi:MAG TPA: hypothetical protein VMV01_19865, partial [Planctomycetota bacterium]|nr:hypothetical protein [Planctomycetota bacterium]
RNSKYPLAQVIQPFNPNVARVEADRVYYSVGGSNGKKLIEVFDLDTGEHLKTIETPVQVGKLASYFSQ